MTKEQVLVELKMRMLQVNKLALATLSTLIIGSSTAYALEAKCNYTNKTIAKTTGVIEATRNFRRESANYTEEKHVCVVKLDVKINGNWYKTSDFYVFGPEISENSACESATKKAKTKALEKHSPQLIDSEITEVCNETIKVKKETPVVEKTIVKQVVYVDRITGREVRHNPVSDSFSCFLLGLFAPTPYYNPRCNVFD